MTEQEQEDAKRRNTHKKIKTLEAVKLLGLDTKLQREAQYPLLEAKGLKWMEDEETKQRLWINPNPGTEILPDIAVDLLVEPQMFTVTFRASEQEADQFIDEIIQYGPWHQVGPIEKKRHDQFPNRIQVLFKLSRRRKEVKDGDNREAERDVQSEDTAEGTQSSVRDLPRARASKAMGEDKRGGGIGWALYFDAHPDDFGGSDY